MVETMKQNMKTSTFYVSQENLMDKAKTKMTDKVIIIRESIQA